MIILSGVLVVVAIALLIAGIVAGNSGTEVVGLDGLNLIYVSIGVSIVSALFLAIGVFLRRKDLFGAPAQGGARTAKRGKAGKGELADTTAKAQAASGAATSTTAGAAGSVYPAGGHTSGSDTDTAELTAMMPPPGDVPPDAVVYVIPGRRRYHIDSCRQLAGRSKEELTFEEAREEGFSPCTACMPDTALAARAAAGGLVTADRPDSESAAGSAAASDDERGADSASRRSEVNGSLGSVTPVQRQALDDLTDDDEPDHPVTQPIALPEDEPARTTGPASGRTAASTADDEPDRTDESDETDDSAADAGESDESTEPPTEPGESDSTSPAPDVPPQASRPAAAGEERPEEQVSAAGDSTLVRILSGTKRYHRPDCALIEDIGDDADDLESLSRAEAKARGCTPCLVCQPDKEPAARD
ncbi:MAG TPA: hypothetical protein VFU43_22165 [Streptosporangiaceae bacterium]|nr:hypothetical protein [Streptosporangiaceae bacterium]